MLARCLLLALLAALLVGCPKTDQSLLLVGGDTVDARIIDSDPLKVLPRGALLISRLDAEALFRSSFGGQLGQLVANLLPLGPESNFIAARDIKTIHAALYAMQGADFCALLSGNFDVNAIRQAAQVQARTPSGLPLVQSRYGDYDIFTVANIGFVLLTQQTILSGTETGMRRALDRLRYGPLDNALAPWMVELLQKEKTAFAVVGDLSSQAVVAAASERLPFLSAISMVRAFGNFQPPGMNIVGSVTYADDQSAAQGRQALSQLQQLTQLLSLLSSFGFGGKLPVLDARQQGKDVAFAAQADASFIQMMLGWAVQTTRLSATTARSY